MHTISELPEWNKSRVHGICSISDIFSVHQEDFPTQALNADRKVEWYCANEEYCRQIALKLFTLKILFSH